MGLADQERNRCGELAKDALAVASVRRGLGLLSAGRDLVSGAKAVARSACSGSRALAMASRLTGNIRDADRRGVPSDVPHAPLFGLMRNLRNTLVLATAGLIVGTVRADPLPTEWWWYWDRPAHQLPVPRPGIGTAVVTTHVYFSGSRVIRVPRRSALTLPPGTVSIPVIHVEVDPAHPFAATDEQRDALRDLVVAEAVPRLPPLIQLDFEARPSQRPFWRASVQAIRERLPAQVRLSVTALASWCFGDRWLAEVPADEIVPMYFRLGKAREAFVARSAAGIPEPRCRNAHGVADDEPPWPVALPGRRYVFLGQHAARLNRQHPHVGASDHDATR